MFWNFGRPISLLTQTPIWRSRFQKNRKPFFFLLVNMLWIKLDENTVIRLKNIQVIFRLFDRAELCRRILWTCGHNKRRTVYRDFWFPSLSWVTSLLKKKKNKLIDFSSFDLPSRLTILGRPCLSSLSVRYDLSSSPSRVPVISISFRITSHHFFFGFSLPPFLSSDMCRITTLTHSVSYLIRIHPIQLDSFSGILAITEIIHIFTSYSDLNVLIFSSFSYPSYDTLIRTRLSVLLRS